MRKIAKRNGKEFPAFLFENSESVEVYVDKHEADTTAVSLLTVLRTSQTLRRRMVNMCLQWFSVTLCYYGLSFASTKLSQNVFTDFMLR